MRWRLFDIVVMVSLLLCAAIAALWVRSHWRVDYVAYGAREWNGELASDRGLLVLIIYTGSWRVPSTPPGVSVGTFSEDLQHIRATMSKWRHGVWAGLGLQPPRSDPSGLWEAGAPHWLVCLFTALPAVAWFAGHRRRRRRQRSNLCRVCGYDLRASPDRCPECGAVAGAA